MVTVAIISEYNPFHLGHEYQLKQIRHEFGEDTAIIAIMSGNYTQRGEIASQDKFLRAKLAVLSGVNLVLELPFPYSISSAEFFAKAGVSIANALGCVDYLSFGSELGDIDELKKIANNLLSKKYKDELSTLTSSKKSSTVGYAALCEEAYLKAFGESINDVFTPNNILALEYIKAIITTKSRIKPHTIKRVGGAYDDLSTDNVSMPSAMAIREIMQNGAISAEKYIPNSAKDAFCDAFGKEFPTNAEKLSSAILSNLRLNPTPKFGEIHDAQGGLYNRLHAASFEAQNIQSLIALTETKKYTTARIKRVIWYSFLGVTSSDVRSTPEYTQVLALDSIGQGVLKKLKGKAPIFILTKPSRFDSHEEMALHQKELSDRADSVFHLTKPCSVSGKYSLLCTPFVKKQK